MKKIKFVVLVLIICMLMGLPVFADEERGSLVIQGYVLEEIENGGYTLYVMVQNIDTYNIYETYLYETNDYKTTINLPVGRYVVGDAMVYGDNTSKYPSKLRDPMIMINEFQGYDFDVIPNGVAELHIAFGEGCTFDNYYEPEDIPDGYVKIETEEALVQTTEAPEETTTPEVEITPETEPETQPQAPVDPVVDPEPANKFPFGLVIGGIAIIGIVVYMAVLKKKK